MNSYICQAFMDQNVPIRHCLVVPLLYLILLLMLPEFIMVITWIYQNKFRPIGTLNFSIKTPYISAQKEDNIERDVNFTMK